MNSLDRAQAAQARDDRALRIARDLISYPNDPPGYAERVRELETEGLCTSDAQGVADVECRQTSRRGTP